MICAEGHANRRSTGVRDSKYARHRWQARLGVDLHPRRSLHRHCRRPFPLGNSGLPGDRKVPERGRACVQLHSISVMQNLMDLAAGAFIIRRLQSDQKISASGEKFNAKYIWQSLKDWKTWVASESLPCDKTTTCLPCCSVHVRRIVSALLDG